jgi:hypothetical protein
MPQKTASRTAAVWTYRVNYFAAALFLLNFLASLTGWGAFANQPRSYDVFSLAESVVFFSIGSIFQVGHRKAR